jgi:RHH-type rel operon transcriptional repressor/antitoxin RelB
MASINLRIDSTLKDQAYARLTELGVTPSELIRQTFEYVVQTGKLPVSRHVLSSDDADLLQGVRERLAAPQAPVTVILDEL